MKLFTPAYALIVMGPVFTEHGMIEAPMVAQCGPYGLYACGPPIRRLQPGEYQGTYQNYGSPDMPIPYYMPRSDRGPTGGPRTEPRRELRLCSDRWGNAYYC